MANIVNREIDITQTMHAHNILIHAFSETISFLY